MSLSTIPLMSTLFANTETDVKSAPGALKGKQLFGLRIIVIKAGTKEPLPPTGFTLRELWWNGTKIFKNPVPCDIFTNKVDVMSNTVQSDGIIHFKIHNPNDTQYAFVAFLQLGE